MSKVLSKNVERERDLFIPDKKIKSDRRRELGENRPRKEQRFESDHLYERNKRWGKDSCF